MIVIALVKPIVIGHSDSDWDSDSGVKEMVSVLVTIELMVIVAVLALVKANVILTMIVDSDQCE